MKENVSGCFFLNTVYIISNRLLYYKTGSLLHFFTVLASYTMEVYISLVCTT